MFFNVLVIVSIEILAVSCFCMGLLLGRNSTKADKKSNIVTKIPDNILDGIMDPISPQEQELIRRLEEEAR